jgi:hypothetical protein
VTHGDHFLGLKFLLDSFPNARAVRSFGLFAPRALKETDAAIFAMLRQEKRPRPKRRRWADSLRRDFGRDPLLDSTGKRMRWIRRLVPETPPCHVQGG